MIWLIVITPQVLAAAILLHHFFTKCKDIREIEIIQKLVTESSSNNEEYKFYWEKECLEKMKYWNEVTIDNIYFAFRSIKVLYGKKGIEKIDDVIKNESKAFVNSLYSPRDGGFKQSFHGFRSIYSTRMADILNKHFYEGQLLTKEQREGMYNYINNLMIEIPNGGIGFRDSLLHDEPKLAVTYGATKILMNLKREGFLNRDEFDELAIRICKFIKSLWNNEKGSYMDYYGHRPRLCALNFGLRTMFEINREEFKNTLDAFKDKIVKFLYSCWREEWGGFAPNESLKYPTLPHTRLALQILNLIYNQTKDNKSLKKAIMKFEDETGLINVQGKIKNFVLLMQDKRIKGFPLMKGLVPSLAGTFNAVLIMGYWLQDKEWIEEKKEGIISFIMRRRRRDGFTGIPSVFSIA